jgi:AcrR family transcriptional regulator
MTSRVEKKRAAAKDEILEIARRHMAEQGAAALSLRAIARELDVTAPALYRYFDNRDALITVLIVEAYTTLAAAIEAAANAKASETIGEQLLAAMMTYRDWALAHPQDYALVFGTPIPGYQGPLEQTVPAAKRAFDVYVSIFEAAEKAGQLKPTGVYNMPTKALKIPLVDWRKNYGYSASTAALHLTLVAWSRMHGLVILELFNFIQPFFGDATELYRTEALQLIAQAGIKL